MSTFIQPLQDYKEDTLSTVSGINSSAVAFAGSTSPFGSPSYKIMVTIDPDLSTKEIMRVTVSGVTYTQAERGMGGTTAQAHSQNAVIRMTLPSDLINPIQDFLEQGWTTVPNYLALVYVSTTQFTLQGDWTAILSKGDKLRLTNSSTKYFYVTSTSFSAGVTTINVTAGTDYTLTAGAISGLLYSKLERPSGFPRVFNFDPAPTGYSVIPSGTVARFSVNGNTCSIFYYSSVDGTSNGTGKSYTLPIAPYSGSGTIGVFVTQCKDSGTSAFGKHAIAYTGSTVTCYPNQSVGSWIASGTSNHVADGVLLTYPI